MKQAAGNARAMIPGSRALFLYSLLTVFVTANKMRGRIGFFVFAPISAFLFDFRK